MKPFQLLHLKLMKKKILQLTLEIFSCLGLTALFRPQVLTTALCMPQHALFLSQGTTIQRLSVTGN